MVARKNVWSEEKIILHYFGTLEEQAELLLNPGRYGIGYMINFVSSLEFRELKKLIRHRQRIARDAKGVKKGIDAWRRNGLGGVEPIAELLKSISASWPIVAITIFAEVSNISRPLSYRNLACYAGLVPCAGASGDKYIG